MMTLNKQIAFLRREKDLTQEQLANALGVSNQAVSKWESGACCPDISLLPDIAKLFQVSIDKLMGYQSTNTSKDIVLEMKERIQDLPHGEDFSYALKLAYGLHAIIFSKCVSSTEQNWDTEHPIEEAGHAAWGYSCIAMPEITSAMRRGSVLFSDNKIGKPNNTQIRDIVFICKSFGKAETLKTAFAIYRLTVHDEKFYTSIDEIVAESNLPKEKVHAILENELSSFLLESYEQEETKYRFDGRYMDLIPLLVLLCSR